MTEPDCWNCGKPITDLPLPVSRHEYCPHCAEPVHCCRMCEHFAPALADQCREERSDPPADKTVANFCDFFTLASRASDAAPAAERARAELDALFGDDKPGDGASAGLDHDAREAAARARLDALFGGGGGDGSGER